MKRITGREVHDQLKGRVDLKVMEVLVAMGEEMTNTRQEINAMAQMMDQIVNSMSAIVAVQGGMKDKIDKMRREDLDDRISPYVQSVDPNKDD